MRSINLNTAADQSYLLFQDLTQSKNNQDLLSGVMPQRTNQSQLQGWSMFHQFELAVVL